MAENMLLPTGKTNDLFAAELKKNLDAANQKSAAKSSAALASAVSEVLNKMMTPDGKGGRYFEVTAAKDTDKVNEVKLDEQRGSQNLTSETEKTEEAQLAGERKGPVEQTMEGQLRDKEQKHAPNAKAEGITEKRLEEASSTLYPHRNEEAHERTGDKRPINALKGEMGDASDEAKDARYESASRASQEQPQRSVDKDENSQLTLEPTKVSGPASFEKATNHREKSAFNQKRSKLAAMIKDCPSYLDYKDDSSGERFAAVRKLDATMASIMESSATEKRQLTDDEMAQVAALKSRKTDLLKQKPVKR